MTTPAEQEAERRYPVSSSGVFWVDVRNRWQAVARRVDFVAGWNECESRHRELLEAAREYNRARKWDGDPWTYATNKRLAMEELVAAAAALDEEGGE